MRRRGRGDQRWILAAGIWRARGCDREDAFAEWPAVPGYWRDAGKFFGVGGGIQFRCEWYRHIEIESRRQVFRGWRRDSISMWRYHSAASRRCREISRGPQARQRGGWQ